MVIQSEIDPFFMFANQNCFYSIFTVSMCVNVNSLLKGVNRGISSQLVSMNDDHLE